MAGSNIPAEEEPFANKAAPGVSYFTPLQSPPAGTALDQPDGKKAVPKVFQPLTVRSVTLPNRIGLSPLCQYSAEDGHYTMWHHAHIGGIASRGPGITIIEATAVLPEGRITPQDVGLWKDSQIDPLKTTVEFAHSQGQKIMIQLGHAGRKASTVAPWLSAGHVAIEATGGWPNEVVAPSAIQFGDGYCIPREMTKAEIERFKEAYGDAVRRALKAGFDGIEIHNAHGYLLHEFLSPVANKRTDEYGGSFENRIRLTLEIVDLVRKIIPDTMPLFLRVSATDWLEETELAEESWTVDQTIRLAEILAGKGVDLLDVSSGGLHPAQKIKTYGSSAYQSFAAKAIKQAVGDRMKVSTVGAISNGKLANELLESGLDMVLVGRGFQKNPGLVFAWADELETAVQMPNQIRWGFVGRAKKALTENKRKL